MTTARDLMTDRPTIVRGDTPIADVARKLREDGIGAAVVCDHDRLQGVVTDRDIAVEVVAQGKDPRTTKAGDIVSGRETAAAGADDDVDEAVRTMTKHAVRRLPVIDGDRVVGMLSQADIARAASDSDVAKLVRSISEAPDNTGQG